MQDSKISVMIADDEENIRAGLKCIMDWEDLGFSVLYEAENGESMLSKRQGKKDIPEGS